MSDIPAGTLNVRIVVEKRDVTRGTLGQASNTWSQFKPLWSRPLGTSGYSASQNASSEGLTKALDIVTFRVRYREDITNTGDFRINVKGRIYDIKMLRPDLANKAYLDIVCQVSSDG